MSECGHICTLLKTVERGLMVGSPTRTTWNGKGVIPQVNGERVAEHAITTKAEDEGGDGEGGKKGENILLLMAELKLKI